MNVLLVANGVGAADKNFLSVQPAGGRVSHRQEAQISFFLRCDVQKECRKRMS